nr:uncharacterized protein LOC113687755 [Coffea arabica]
MEEAQLGLEEAGPRSTPPRVGPARSMPPTSLTPILPTCVCGMKTVMITSWTAQNPGRRFAKCALGEDGCGYWGWIDDEMCARSTMIIPGLLRKINGMEEKMVEFEKAARKWEAKAVKLEGKMKPLQTEIAKYKSANKRLIRCAVLPWLIVVLAMLVMRIDNSGGMLQICGIVENP